MNNKATNIMLGILLGIKTVEFTNRYLLTPVVSVVKRQMKQREKNTWENKINYTGPYKRKRVVGFVGQYDNTAKD